MKQQTEKERVSMIKTSLPIFIENFDKFFEIEEVVTKDTLYPTHLRVVSESGTINAYWTNKILENYVCEVHKDGLHIVGLKNRIKILDLINKGW